MAQKIRYQQIGGGSASQFVKADGSVDSNTYAPNSALSGYLPLAGGVVTGKTTLNQGYWVSGTSGRDLVTKVKNATTHNSVILKVSLNQTSTHMGSWEFDIFRYVGQVYKFKVSSYKFNNSWNNPTVQWIAGNPNTISSIRLLKQNDTDLYIEVVFTTSASYTNTTVGFNGALYAPSTVLSLFTSDELDTSGFTVVNDILPTSFQYPITTPLTNFVPFTGSPNDVNLNDKNLSNINTLGVNNTLNFADKKIPSITVENTGYNKRIDLFQDKATNAPIASWQTNYWNGSSFSSDNSMSFGIYAGQNNVGISSSLFGYASGQSNTGSNTSSFGYVAGQFNTGANPSFFGYGAGRYNLGTSATFFGYTAGQFNIANNCIGVGLQSERYNTGLESNVVGTNSAMYNVGNYVQGLGAYSAQFNTGNLVTSIGHASLRYNVGQSNTVLGYNTLGTFKGDTSKVKTFNATDINTTSKTITVTGHGWGVAGSYINVIFTQGTSTIIGMSNGTITQLKIIDDNTVAYSETLSSGQERLLVNITGAGTGTGHTFTPQIKFDNIIAIGAGITWDNVTKNNQTIIKGQELIAIDTTATTLNNDATGKTLVTKEWVNSQPFATNSHTHSNKPNLDTINQNLGTTYKPSFTGLTLNQSSTGLGLYTGFESISGDNTKLYGGAVAGTVGSYIGQAKYMISNQYQSNKTFASFIKFGISGDIVFYGDASITPDTNYTPTMIARMQSNGNFTANQISITGGTSSQFLKADGSVDSNSYSLTSHNHNGVYEPVFSKNTAFNKNFGTTTGTVAEGNHNHDSVYAPINHTHTIANITGLQTALDSKDNYQSWNLKTNGVQRTTIVSGGNLDIVAGSNVTVNYSAGGVVTLSSTDTVYTHPNSGVTAGTYKSVTVNAQGHVTAGTNPTTLSGYGITDAMSTSHVANGITSTNISNWNYIADNGIIKNVIYSSNSGYAVLLSDNNIGGEAGLIDNDAEIIIAGIEDDLYKFGTPIGSSGGVIIDPAGAMGYGGVDPTSSHRHYFNGTIRITDGIYSEQTDSGKDVYSGAGDLLRLNSEIERSGSELRFKPYSAKYTGTSNAFDTDHRDVRIILLDGGTVTMVQQYAYQQILIMNPSNNDATFVINGTAVSVIIPSKASATFEVDEDGEVWMIRLDEGYCGVVS